MTIPSMFLDAACHQYLSFLGRDLGSWVPQETEGWISLNFTIGRAIIRQVMLQLRLVNVVGKFKSVRETLSYMVFRLVGGKLHSMHARMLIGARLGELPQAELYHLEGSEIAVATNLGQRDYDLTSSFEAGYVSVCRQLSILGDHGFNTAKRVDTFSAVIQSRTMLTCYAVKVTISRKVQLPS